MKNIKKVIIFCLIIGNLTITSCVTNQRSEAIRNDLKNSAMSDLRSAITDVKAIASKDLTEETINKMNAIDKQYKLVLDTLKMRNIDTQQNISLADEKYKTEKERIKMELFDRAQFYTKILIKIENGIISIESISNMNQSVEEARKIVLGDVIFKDLPIAIISPYTNGKIDSDFFNIISKNIDLLDFLK